MRGGGIYNKGTITISNTTICGNDADDGGGINNSEGTMTITNSTISGNHGGNTAGGIDNSGYSNLIIKNSTICNNEGGFTGGIAGDNLSFLVEIQNTIIALNTAYLNQNCSRQGAVLSLGHNLIGERGECGYNPDIGDIFAADPMIGPLSENGGPTLTHAILAGSPAIDAGDSENCPETDQRGFSRPEDGDNDGNAICDIGSFELQKCKGDFDQDGDVDGVDVVNQTNNGTEISLVDFSKNFGRDDCP